MSAVNFLEHFFSKMQKKSHNPLIKQSDFLG